MVIVIWAFLYYTHHSRNIPYIAHHPTVIQKGTTYFLYDYDISRGITTPSFVFNSISEYAVYVAEQKRKGLPYPDIFIQHIIDVQGNDAYVVRTDPLNPQVADYVPVVEGLETQTSTKDKHTSPYDRNIYMNNIAANIASNLSISQIQNINKLELTKSVLSQDPPKKCSPSPEDITPLVKNGLTADPMTKNWGGIPFTQKLIDDGYYVGSEVLTYRR